LQFRRLAAIDDRLDDMRRQERQAQHTPELGLVDLLGLGNFTDCGILAGLQHIAPAEGAGWP
jgi:hypothetical protein